MPLFCPPISSFFSLLLSLLRAKSPRAGPFGVTLHSLFFFFLTPWIPNPIIRVLMLYVKKVMA